MSKDIREVRIPACVEHGGIHRTRVKVEWVCPRCGGPRGDIYQGFSYDGSRRLAVDCWRNECGHIDFYSKVRDEAATNGLNFQGRTAS